MPDFESSPAVAYDAQLSDLERLIAQRLEPAPSPAARSEKIPPRLYGIMALTTALTFGTLMTGYQLLFPPHQLFA